MAGLLAALLGLAPGTEPPLEIIALIYAYLTSRDLALLASVSRSARNLASSVALHSPRVRGVLQDLKGESEQLRSDIVRDAAYTRMRVHPTSEDEDASADFEALRARLAGRGEAAAGAPVLVPYYLLPVQLRCAMATVESARGMLSRMSAVAQHGHRVGIRLVSAAEFWRGHVRVLRAWLREQATAQTRLEHREAAGVSDEVVNELRRFERQAQQWKRSSVSLASEVVEESDVLARMAEMEEALCALAWHLYFTLCACGIVGVSR